jgi:hypothetical protein
MRRAFAPLYPLFQENSTGRERIQLPKQLVEKLFDGVILSEAKNLLFISDAENKSRFFSPADTAGLQNDTSRGFSTNS